MREFLENPRIVIPFLIVSLGAVACSSNSINGYQGPRGDGGTQVQELVLPDGTPCAVMDAMQGNALDCDWGGAKEKPTDLQGDAGTGITEVTLVNGVLCAVMDSGHGKALSCDWGGKRGARSKTNPRGSSGTAITLVSLPGGMKCAVMDAAQGKALSCS